MKRHLSLGPRITLRIVIVILGRVVSHNEWHDSFITWHDSFITWDMTPSLCDITHSSCETWLMNNTAHSTNNGMQKTFGRIQGFFYRWQGSFDEHGSDIQILTHSLLCMIGCWALLVEYMALFGRKPMALLRRFAPLSSRMTMHIPRITARKTLLIE